MRELDINASSFILRELNMPAELTRYKVFFHTFMSPVELQVWLNEMYFKEDLELVSFSGDYFVFKWVDRRR